MIIRLLSRQPGCFLILGCYYSLVKLAVAGEGLSISQPFMVIGYYDAKAQHDLPSDVVQYQNLTHLVLTHAVNVDKDGRLHYRQPTLVDELSGEDLINKFVKLPVKLIISLRGIDSNEVEDDVAFDELAENDTVRQQFSADIAERLRTWGASGLEIEWHADDVGGGKAVAAPFDKMEQYHFSLLCRDLSSSFRSSGVASTRTLSVAVRPGRKEFASGLFVRKHIDWLSVRAYSMRSLGDPHHSSLRDMEAAIAEWANKGVRETQLVLGTPLFGRPGAALHSAGDRNEELRRSWKDLVGLASPSASFLPNKSRAQAAGDRLVDTATGKTWWVSGLETTAAKAVRLLKKGCGGIAFRSLHQDAQRAGGLSLIDAAVRSLKEERETLQISHSSPPMKTVSLLQQKTRRQQVVHEENGDDL